MKSSLFPILLLALVPILMLSLGLKAIAQLTKLATALSSQLPPLPPAIFAGILICTAFAQYQWITLL